MAPASRMLVVFSATVLLATAPLTARAQLVLDLSDGGGSVVNYHFSGSTTISAGGAIATLSSALRLPDANGGNWSSFFTQGSFDDSGSELLSVTNVTTGTFAASGLPVLSVNGAQIQKVGGGFASEGDWVVTFSSDPAFRFEIQNALFDFDYPAVSGGEVLTLSGSGSFDVGAGSFTTNFNVGTYNFTGTSGIATRVNVVPEPATIGLAAAGLAGAAMAFRRRQRARRRSDATPAG